MSHRRYTSPGRVVRLAFAGATVAFGVLGLLLGEGSFLVASGAFGLLWTVWELVWDRVFTPLGQWAARVLMEGGGGSPPNTRPTIDDTIRLLESHLAQGASRGVEIQSAIRLEEIYRTVRKDSNRASAVIRRITAKYPEAPELRRFRKGSGD